MTFKKKTGMIREGIKHKNINLPFRGGIQMKYYPNIQVQLKCWVLDIAAKCCRIGWTYWKTFRNYQNKICTISPNVWVLYVTSLKHTNLNTLLAAKGSSKKMWVGCGLVSEGWYGKDWHSSTTFLPQSSQTITARFGKKCDTQQWRVTS